MKKNPTKRALLTSVFSLALCLVMLLGTTFAWFTDTASTAVNKIVSGKLDVALEMKDGDNWVNAEGKTLTFKTADNRSADKILWEPGATYELPALRIVNNGNLALKAYVQVTGIQSNGGDAVDLRDVIEWTTSSFDGMMTYPNNDISVKMKPNDTWNFNLQGHMKETAGNDYQGLEISGVAITVVATQDTVEKDSISDQYDKDAAYPTTIADLKTQYGSDGLRMPAGVTIADNTDGTFDITLTDEEAFLYFTQVFDRAAAYEARMKAWDAGQITRYPHEYNLSSLNMWYGPYCNRITVKMACDVDLVNRTVTPFGLSGYVFNFDGNGHTIKNAKVAATSDAGFFAARVNIKNVTLDNIHVFATGSNSAGVVAGAPNSFIENVTVKNSSVTGAKYTGAIAGYDYGDITGCTVENTVVSGQYKVGGIVGYVCSDNAEQVRNIKDNTLTNVTVKGENIWAGKEDTGFVVGKIVGNWDALTGYCTGNSFSGTTAATGNIGQVESRVTGLTQ